MHFKPPGQTVLAGGLRSLPRIRILLSCPAPIATRLIEPAALIRLPEAVLDEEALWNSLWLLPMQWVTKEKPAYLKRKITTWEDDERLRLLGFTEL